MEHEAESYIALPLSDISSIYDLPPDAEVRIPEFIPGSWEWSGPWLSCSRAIDRGGLSAINGKDWNKNVCPECYSNSTCYLVLERHAVLYCLDCQLQWLNYTAWCPTCGGFLWNKECNEGEVACIDCKQVWSVDIAKRANELGDIMVGL